MSKGSKKRAEAFAKERGERKVREMAADGTLEARSPRRAYTLPDGIWAEETLVERYRARLSAIDRSDAARAHREADQVLWEFVYWFAKPVADAYSYIETDCYEEWHK